MLKFILLTTAAIAAVSPAFAEDNSENVIVTATRIATPQSQIASSVSVVTAADIESRQQVSLPDVLRDVPGLNIVQTGGEGGQTSIFSRGTNSNHTKILVDGIDVADPSTPTNVFDFGKLNAADIARVEVLRGPGSGLYGSDAIGGVINVITKAGEGPLAATAHLEGGSFDTFNQDATAGGSDDGFHYRFTLAHQHAGDTPVTPSSLLLPGEKANGDFYDSVSGSTKLGYDVTDYFNLGFVGRASNILEKITGDGFNFKTFTGFPSPTQSRIAAVQYDARGTAHLVLGLLDQTIGLAYSSSATANADPNNGNSRNSGARVKLDWQGNIALANDETLVLGAETARDAIHLPLSAGITTNAGYAELQSALGDFDNSVSVRYDDNSRFGNKVTWRLAPVYKVGGTRLKASIGSGFKAPSLEDLFGPFGHNPNLKPETSIGYDMGLDQQLGTDFSGGVTWFHNDIRNLIESGPPPSFAPVNVGKARTQGVEAYLAWAPMDTLKLRADYTYTEAADAVFHTPLLRRPKNKLSGDIAWQAWPGLSADLTVLYVGSTADIGRENFLPLKLPSYVTANISVNYALTDMFSLYGRADNLFDERYQNPSGFRQPGLAFYAGVKANL
ncbi:MAG TPA: TonB-dependent receptor [Rhizomicrobium sp.]|jgi:vitamin B12 transporter|nr:TonB-dependent receptor [Rhizomicrobium sp.]